jgi:hypothetical protein
MQVGLNTKLKAMFLDLPEKCRLELSNEILSNPFQVFQRDEQLLIKALNSLKWYELTGLLGKQNLFILLTDSTIRKLYPVQRRTYYANARRLLSKYFVSDSEQSSENYR